MIFCVQLLGIKVEVMRIHLAPFNRKLGNEKKNLIFCSLIDEVLAEANLIGG